MSQKLESWPLSRRGGIISFKSVLLAALVSFAFYICLFVFVLQKPQTLGQYQKLIEAKTETLRELANEKKLILLAGSNGRVSHRAELIGAAIDLPAVNMSITASMSLDYQIERIKKYISSGDVLYLPLEYSQLQKGKKATYSSIEAPYVVAYDKAALWKFSNERKIHALLYFDVKFIFSAATEMFLSAMNYRRRITSDDFNKWGDQTGHTIEKAKSYRDYIESVEVNVMKALDATSYSAQTISSFLQWATDQGITVVGGYPTLAKGLPIPEDELEALRAFYKDQGHDFLELPNKGRYPKAHFFDTIYHLSEPYQINHSKLVGQHLKALLQEKDSI